jgi:DNA transformation protein
MASDFIDYLVDVLAPLGSVRSKRMFGGVGVYIDGLFCAIVVDDCLYFKGDDENEPEFAAANCLPFTYANKEGGVYSMRYYRVPDEAMDDQAVMLHWARLGLAAALRKTVKPAAKKRAAPGVRAKPDPTRLG